MKKEIFLNIFIIVISCTVTLLLLEVILRIFHIAEPAADRYGWKVWHIDDSHLSEKNDFGFRGLPMDPEASFSVILTGDSQVETSHPFEEMPERYLKKSLESLSGETVNVVSIGSWGWGTDQQYLAIERYIENIRPRCIAVWICDNDFMDNIYPQGQQGPKPTFHLEGETLIPPDIRWMSEPPRGLRIFSLMHTLSDRYPVLNDVQFYEGYIKKELRQEESFPCHPETSTEIDLADYFVTKTGIEKYYEHYAKGPGSVKNFDSMRSYYRFFIYSNPEYELGTGKSMFKLYLSPRPPLIEYGCTLMNRILLKLKETAAQHGTDIVLFRVQEPYILFEEPIEICYKEKRLTLSYERYLKNYAEAANGLDLITIDGLPGEFRDLYDGHLSDESNQIVMDRLAEWIHQNIN